MPSKVQRWYPSRSDFPDAKQFEVVRQLTDMVYHAHDTISELKRGQQEQAGKLNAHHARILKAEDAGGPSTTRIGGLFVKGVPPADGQTLKYNAKTGQIEWS